MFTGMFGQRNIRATHPHIVVAGEKVLGSFNTLEAAEEFISKKGRSAALVLRHQGQEWIVAEDQLVEPIRRGAKSGLSRAEDAQALSLRNVTMISNIEAALQKYPRITYRADMHSLEVPAQTRNGFQVSIRQRADRYTLGFEKWHQEFTNAASAFDFFMFGLSRVCRLHVFSCGGVEYKWQVQRQFDGRWYTVGESGLAVYPFWWKRTEKLLQNDVIIVG